MLTQAASFSSTSVLVPGNFSEGKMVASNVENFVKEGFRVGEHVMLQKRITVKFGEDPNDRKDVPEGTKVPVKGFVGTNWVVCEFEIDVSSGKKPKMRTIDWKVDKDKLILEKFYIAQMKEEATSKEEQALKSKFSFLRDMKDAEVISDWEGKQMRNDTDTMPERRIKNAIGFHVDTFAKQICPPITEKDFLIVKRSGQYEVYTLKEFKPRQICLAPETSEMKSVWWTHGRSAMVKNTSSFAGVGKAMVLDGRVRAYPADGKSAFSMYWIISRIDPETEQADQKINLVMEYVKCEYTMQFKIGDGKGIDDHDVEMKHKDCPSFPILTNPKKIGKGVRLMAMEDLDLKKYAADLEKELEDKKKEEEAKKKRKGGLENEGKDNAKPSGSPPSGSKKAKKSGF